MGGNSLTLLLSFYSLIPFYVQEISLPSEAQALRTF